MARKAYARRYARALFEIALQAGEIEEWGNSLQQLSAAIGVPEFSSFLSSPKVRFEEKKKALSKTFKNINPMLLNLVYLLISRDSLEYMEGIVQEYRRLVNQHLGIEHAKVLTAVDVNEEEKQSIIRHLEKLTGKQITAETITDPELLGGVVARIDGKLLDGSTRSRLIELKKQLAGGRR